MGSVYPSLPKWSIVIGMRVWFLLVTVATVSVCVADGHFLLPWYFSFMDVMCNLSSNIARIIKSIRCSLSPVGADGGCGLDSNIQEL